MNSKENTLGPFLVLTFVFFIVGFMTIVNGQCQGPLKVAFLTSAGGLKNTFTSLISFSFFLGFLVNGIIGGQWINKYGYKKTLLKGLNVMIIGLFIYFISAWFAKNYNDVSLHIGNEIIPYGFFIFLLGSFLMGSAAALLQTVITPYVSSYELPNTQPVQRVNITCAANSFGTTIAPFFVTGIMFSGVAIEDVQVDQVMIPFLLIALCVTLTRFIVGKLPLPDIKNTRIENDKQSSTNIWSFRHLKLGVIAIFFYVGAEVAVGTNINLHAMEMQQSSQSLSFLGNNTFSIGNLDLGIPALLATIYWGGMMIGRIVSSFFNTIHPRTQLAFSTIMAIILITTAVITNNLWILVSVGLFHSVMWGCIFTLAVKGLNQYTSKASGIFMMGAFGGAIFPLLQGLLADIIGSWQYTWIIIIACELVMLYYAMIGSRIRRRDLQNR